MPSCQIGDPCTVSEYPRALTLTRTHADARMRSFQVARQSARHARAQQQPSSATHEISVYQATARYVLGRAEQATIGQKGESVSDKRDRIGVCLTHFAESCDLVKGQGLGVAVCGVLLAASTSAAWNLYVSQAAALGGRGSGAVFIEPLRKILDALVVADGKNNRRPPNLPLRVEMYVQHRAVLASPNLPV
jgi:hypothetical protein